MATVRDLLNVCETVLASKARGDKTTTVNGMVFDDNYYDPAEGGRCQENSRKAYEAATGQAMPGKDCCAGHTFRNLSEDFTKYQVAGANWDESKLKPGDFLFFEGGPKCHTCSGSVGHIGIWLGNGRMFQQTSRDGLGITQQGPTENQKARFVGAFRLVQDDPAAKPEVEEIPSWAALAVEWVTGVGLLTRDAKGNFNPNHQITRAELAVILQRIATRGGLGK